MLKNDKNINYKIKIDKYGKRLQTFNIISCILLLLTALVLAFTKDIFKDYYFLILCIMIVIDFVFITSSIYYSIIVYKIKKAIFQKDNELIKK